MSLLLLAKNSPPYSPVNRKIDTFVDSFGSLSRWVSSESGLDTPNGVLYLPCNGTDSYTSNVTSVDTVNMAGSSVYMKAPVRPASGGQTITLYVIPSGGGKLMSLSWTATTMSGGFSKTGQVPSSLATSSVAATDWGRIREANGQLYFDYSTDGTNWTQFGQLSHPFTFAELDSCKIMVSNDGAPGSQGTLPVDHVNYTPPVVSGGGGGALSFVAAYPSDFVTSGTPKTASVTVPAGGLIVSAAVGETHAAPLFTTPTGGGLTFTQVVDQGFNGRGHATIHKAISASAQTFTESQSLFAGSVWGFEATVWSGASDVGASGSNTGSNTAPNMTVTTTADNSGLLVAVVEWSAVAYPTRTWRTINGYTPTAANGGEIQYYNDSAHYTVLMAYYPDAGTAGSKFCGLTTVLGGHTIVGCEILKGGGGGGATEYPRRQLGSF